MNTFTVTVLFRQPGIASFSDDMLKLSGEEYVMVVERRILADSESDALRKFWRAVVIEQGGVVIDKKNAYHVSQMVQCYAVKE